MTMSYTGLRRYVDGRNTDFRRTWARYGLPGMRQDVAAAHGLVSGTRGAAHDDGYDPATDR